jgi:hypothetical protein
MHTSQTGKTRLFLRAGLIATLYIPMHACIFIYIHTNTYIYTHILSMYVYIYIHTYTHTNTYIYTHIADGQDTPVPPSGGDRDARAASLQCTFRRHMYNTRLHTRALRHSILAHTWCLCTYTGTSPRQCGQATVFRCEGEESCVCEAAGVLLAEFVC